MEEYTYGITRRGIRPYGHLAQYRGLTGDLGELTPVLGLASDLLRQSLTARGAWRIPQGSPSGELNWGRKKALVSPGEGEWRSKRDTGQFFSPITYPNTREELAQPKIVESCEGVRCRPARSSADVCQRGTVRQRMEEATLLVE